MKRINQFIMALTPLLVLFLAGCSKLLEEKPRSIFTPDFFKTERGVLGGITSQYAHLRFLFGHPYYYNSLETGTDEYTWAQSADGNFRAMDMSGLEILNAQSSRSDNLWGVAFSNINTANGIIENASAVGVAEALVSEARFFRAFDYFMLVQTFGGVPLDLGAGELKFNSSPSRKSVRNTVPEVYTKAIFPDLVMAISNLPVVPRVTGGVTKTVARLYLAKAYLTYAWWLQNPNNIPTYPTTSRTDPDGKNATWYFQEAYNIAVQGINEAPSNYGLVETFYDLHRGGNDRNKEMLLFADHTEESEFFNGSPITGFQGELGGGRNTAVWMATWNYTVITSAANSDGTGAAVSSVQREAVQPLGRPWTRMAPPVEVFTKTFAEKTLDSRFDGTFTSAYRANWPKGGTSNPVLYNANDMPVLPGDKILSFLDYDSEAVGIVYPSGQRFPGKSSNNIGAGQMPGRSDFVIAPSGISRVVYPGLWKMGVHRTNAVGLGEPNAPSTRPFKVAKFSEFYLVAAEAAVKGATTVSGKSARDLINVIRARAGKWKFSNRNNVTMSADNSAAMVAATPAVIDINYILEERSREYFGEALRWFDLVRTQKWNEIAGTYSIAGIGYGQHTPQTVTRTIQPFHYLRPIPQGQLDGMEMTEEEKAAYQNPGY
jgi:starch-binding outer membrane protein, SusD/RagB family